MKLFIGVDLGSTNIKAGLYRASDFTCLEVVSEPVCYDRRYGVELDLTVFEQCFIRLVRKLALTARDENGQIEALGIAGQAETLVPLDSDGHPLMRAISWMDGRAWRECGELGERFSPEECEKVTGQREILPTWPAAKILWLKKNRPEIFEKTAYYLLLKDYLVYRLTGRMLADCSIASFSFYFDIHRKCYWEEMLKAIGICRAQLPELSAPCLGAGKITRKMALLTGLPENVSINSGMLDHFAGMIGMGSAKPGTASLSLGTVTALTALIEGDGHGKVLRQPYGLPLHYGLWEGSYAVLAVAESGASSLEWFRRTCMPQTDYADLNRELAARDMDAPLWFLPYLSGVSAPEFDRQARGMFYGLTAKHDAVDLARAVMEGVGFVLRKNCEAISRLAGPVTSICATGGGTRSAFWCQMLSDITDLPITVLKEPETTCLGAAMAAAVQSGECPSYQEAYRRAHRESLCYEPCRQESLEERYQKFCGLYRLMIRWETTKSPW